MKKKETKQSIMQQIIHVFPECQIWMIAELHYHKQLTSSLTVAYSQSYNSRIRKTSKGHTAY